MLSMRMDIAVKAGGGEQTAVKPAAEMRKRYAVIVGMREWSDKDAADAAHAKAFVDATPKLVKALKAASAASSGVASEDPLVALVAPGSAGATPPAWAAAARSAVTCGWWRPQTWICPPWRMRVSFGQTCWTGLRST